MSYQVTLLVFGILLFLVGLVGKVKAKEIEVGTSSRMARIVMAFLGIVLVVLSFNPNVTQTLIPMPPTPTGDTTQGGPQQSEKQPEPAPPVEEQPPNKVEPHHRKQLQGIYTIQEESTHRYMDAHEDTLDNSVVTRNRQNNDTQRWILTPLGNNTYTIQQKSNKRYLDAWVEYRDYSVVTRDWQNNDTQRWILTPLNDSTYTIQQKSNERYLDAEVRQDEYPVVTRDRQDNSAQRWIIKPSS